MNKPKRTVKVDLFRSSLHKYLFGLMKPYLTTDEGKNMINMTERGSYDNNPIDTTIHTNIFWEHYRKKQGGHLWKDLASETHKERVQTLEKFTTHMMRIYFQNPKEYGFSLRSAKFYVKLLNWILKNPDISVIKNEPL